jgi:hypothetical protein
MNTPAQRNGKAVTVMRHKNRLESDGYTEVVFLRSESGSSADTAVDWSTETYAAKKDGNCYEVDVTESDDARRPVSRYPDVSQRRISDGEYAKVVSAASRKR